MDIKKSWIYILCNIVFVLFCFCYLFYYQADLLSLMQYTYSNGLTHYNHLWGAILIALLLLSVNIIVAKTCRKLLVFPAWTFFPASILLTFLTGGQQTEDMNLTFSFIAIVSIIVVLLYVLFSWLILNIIKTNNDIVQNDTFIKNLWINLLIVVIQFLYICTFSNNDKLFHARIHILQCLYEKDYDNALSTISKLDKSDTHITTLAIYTLSKQNVLAERLFEFPLKGGSDALLPDYVITGKCRLQDIYNNLNLKVPNKHIDNNMEYLRHCRKANKRTVDYMLCGYLMDKDLDSFAEAITKYYDINDSLPKHYREALTLYVHSHTTPKVIFKNSIMDADFQDYQNMEREIPNATIRRNELRKTYGNTYWYYYQYAIS